jgi:hypothetical protein
MSTPVNTVQPPGAVHDATMPVPNKIVQLLTGGSSVGGFALVIVSFIYGWATQGARFVTPAEIAGAIIAAAGIVGLVWHHEGVSKRYLSWLDSHASWVVKLGSDVRPEVEDALRTAHSVAAAFDDFLKKDAGAIEKVPVLGETLTKILQAMSSFSSRLKAIENWVTTSKTVANAQTEIDNATQGVAQAAQGAPEVPDPSTITDPAPPSSDDIPPTPAGS